MIFVNFPLEILNCNQGGKPKPGGQLDKIPPFERDFANRLGQQARIKLMKNLNFEENALEGLGHLNGYCKFAKGKVRIQVGKVALIR